MHILAAEDDPTSREIIRRIITSEKRFTVVMANDGLEAWNLLSESGSHFDACFFDVMMPGLSAFDLLDRMRAHPKFMRTPVILCTAAHDLPTVQLAKNHSVFGYLVKPCDRVAALEKLHRMERVLEDEGRLPMQGCQI